MKGYKKFALLIMSVTLLTACNNGRADEKAKIKEAIQKNNELNNKVSQNTSPVDSKAPGGSPGNVEPPKEDNPPAQSPSKGITVNKMDFEVVNIQELKPYLKSYFESKKGFKGYSTYKDEDGYTYIGVFSGRKNTGGYLIKVLHVEDIEGKTVVTVQEISPKPSAIVTQAITYPYTVIRLKEIEGTIVVKDIRGQEFKGISTGVER